MTNAWDKDHKELLLLFILLHTSLLLFQNHAFEKLGAKNLVTRFNLHIKQVLMPKKAI